MTCIYCLKEAGAEYRVNAAGVVFCSDECYENYMENQPDTPDDVSHPYIDTYELIRFHYIDWLRNWESDLEKVRFNNPQGKADEMNDTIDEIIDAHGDFVRAEGDDGVFAKEIYRYVLKFEELQKQILDWRPERQAVYYLPLDELPAGSDGRFRNWRHFADHLYGIKAVNLFFLLKDNVHPYDEMVFWFEDEAYLAEVYEELARVFGDGTVKDLEAFEAYRCEGSCGDYVVIEDIDREALDGWFYCWICEESYCPGFFSEEELLEEIKKVDAAESIQEMCQRRSNWFSYIPKIKRSCRRHSVAFPDWIDCGTA
ncbi:hypothetical protein [Indiicoccus explosivorum]|uniref:hypothetical protein n=1 Tax=Indiicoccus explosivorum TaxID=1917864 RepID=UPI000B453260|nr:hypothetical protein [Indiicoccus explosivorum]